MRDEISYIGLTWKMRETKRGIDRYDMREIYNREMERKKGGSGGSDL